MKAALGRSVRSVLLNAWLLGAAQTALANAHTWDINEVFSNADGTIQFVEFRETEGMPNEGLITSRPISSDLGAFIIGGDAIEPPTSNRYFLLATPAFAALPGAPTPDAIIPEAFVPFVDTSGDTIDYYFYDSFAFGAVPTNGIDSLRRDLTTGVNTPTNYAGVSGQVNASVPAVPALNGLGVGLGALLLGLAGIAVARRSRSLAV